MKEFTTQAHINSLDGKMDEITVIAHKNFLVKLYLIHISLDIKI